MQRATKDILYFETGPDNEPTMWVDPGEEFEVVTQMNRGRGSTTTRTASGCGKCCGRAIRRAAAYT